MFWEGERPVTGRVEVETWVGNRHDEEFRVAGVPHLKTIDVDAEKKISHYVDPVTALLRVEIKKGRNILALDSDGASDPYCEVALVDPVGVKPEQSQATHFIDDVTEPEWDRTFNFIVAKPYSDDLVLRVYDYDGATSFDDLIGQATIGVHELAVHQVRGRERRKKIQWTSTLLTLLTLLTMLNVEPFHAIDPNVSRVRSNASGFFRPGDLLQNAICVLKLKVSHDIAELYEYDEVISGFAKKVQDNDNDNKRGHRQRESSPILYEQGIKKPPEEKWITLVDKGGNDKNAEGEVYGEVLVRAYLDEEYFEHLHGGNAKVGLSLRHRAYPVRPFLSIWLSKKEGRFL